MRLVSLSGETRRGVVELGDVRVEASLSLVPDAAVGDYVIIHAGYAIEKLDEEEARSRIRLFQEVDASTLTPNPSPASGRRE